MSEKRKERLLDYLVSLAGRVLNISPSEIDVQEHIQNIGFESKSLVQFVEEVSEAFDEEIHPGVMFEHTELASFAEYVCSYCPDKVDSYFGIQQSDSSALKGEGSEIVSTSSRQNQMGGKKVPVIIGGGISGSLISHQLSKHKIDHIIIGGAELGDSPKLGESMTEVVSIEFARNFSHLSQYFYPKQFTPFYMGKLVAGLSFRFFESLASIFMNEDAPKSFIHVDRLGFDTALYQEVIQAPECTWIEDLVMDPDYDERSDSIKKLTLKNGQVIEPSYVWDCTNHIRLLGRKLNIPCHDFDAQRKVFFTHYYKKDDKKLCDLEEIPWMHATSLLRAEKEYDGLAGVSWLIPLGDYVSVGISMLPEDVGDRNPEEIITLLTKAYAKRGLEYSNYFPRRKEIIAVPSQHFMYEKFTGNNWALVGGSSSSTWFTSGSNISIVASMASVADKIIEDPQKYGEYYSNHILGFKQTQKVYDHFMEAETGPIEASKFLTGIIEQARRRISSFFMFDTKSDSETAKLAAELWREDVPIDRSYFEFLRQIAIHVEPELRKDQTAAIFEKFAELSSQHQRVALPYLKGNPIRQRKAELFQQETTMPLKN